MTTRHTLVLSTAAHAAALAGAPALVARPVSSDRGVLLLGQRVGDDARAGEVVVGLGPSALSISATDTQGTLPSPTRPVAVGAVRVVGDSWRLLLPADGPDPAPCFDRQIRSFGHDGQRVLRELRVGIVGAGGTGSALFEQLVRLGVGDIVTIDPDEINDDGSNVTRVYGSTMDDIGTAKVDIAKRHAEQIGIGTTVTAIRGTINDEATARLLIDCDVIFGCTDDNRGRVTLGRLSTWYLIPVIDMGVKITANAGSLQSIEGRITVVEPGQGCLQCRGRINLAALQSEVLTSVERTRRVEEGYAAGLDEPDPAVIAYTTATAAHAANELLHRLFALDQVTPSGELIIRFHARDIRRNTRAGRPGHWCTDTSYLGRGDVTPFLGTTWAS